MEYLLHKTLNTIKMLNDKLGGKIIKKNEFKEEEENIQNFIKFKNNLDCLLEALNNEEKLKDHDWVNKRLIDLQLQYFDAIWHLDQMQELIDKIIKADPD